MFADHFLLRDPCRIQYDAQLDESRPSFVETNDKHFSPSNERQKAEKQREEEKVLTEPPQRLTYHSYIRYPEGSN